MALQVERHEQAPNPDWATYSVVSMDISATAMTLIKASTMMAACFENTDMELYRASD